MTAWTLENEVRGFAPGLPLDAAVARLQLLPGGSAPYELTLDEPFRRTGSETYCAFFTVASGETRCRWVIKACVVTTRTLTEVVAEWVSRAELLATYGVHVPRIAAVQGAAMLQEYIPFTLTEVLQEAEGPRRLKLLTDTARLLGTVSACGFPAVGITRDLRSRGNDVVLVDFGQDLGPPWIADTGGSADLEVMLDMFENIDAGPENSELPTLLEAYEQAERYVCLSTDK